MKLTPCLLLVMLAATGCAGPALKSAPVEVRNAYAAADYGPPSELMPTIDVLHAAKPVRKKAAAKPSVAAAAHGNSAKALATKVIAPATTVAAARPAAPTSTSPIARAKKPNPSPSALNALTPDAERLTSWIASTRDNAGAPYIVIDKRQARLWLFDARGAALGSTAILLGAARGDHTVPGVGDKPLDQVARWERTTPAGRFPIEAGRNAKGEDIFWVDYDAAVSMHRVRATVAAERRLERLDTITPYDNRISWGCINVPVAFYERSIQPAFARGRGVVYILPERESVRATFASLAERAGDVPIRPALLAEVSEQVGTELRRFDAPQRP